MLLVLNNIFPNLPVCSDNGHIYCTSKSFASFLQSNSNVFNKLCVFFIAFLF